MGDESPYEPHIVPMMALGRHFKIGDLYDYCSDRILTGMLNILKLGIVKHFGYILVQDH